MLPLYLYNLFHDMNACMLMWKRGNNDINQVRKQTVIYQVDKESHGNDSSVSKFLLGNNYMQSLCRIFKYISQT